ncbi:MAG TPA: hypothetical protein VGD80_39750 [Kofleriaceae bacterium]
MMYRLGLAAALVTTSACAPVVDVSPLHPTPHCLMARAVTSVKVFAEYPEHGVAVYNLDASNGYPGELHEALQSKAADLGCDGLLIKSREGPTHSRGQAATGQLNDHRELVPGHISALCLVLAKE